jgi:DnaJ-domain-containing protein 1
LFFFALFPAAITATAQTALPEVFIEGTVKEQMNYVQEKTRIYEDFRAIREDMFQKLKRNATDSIDAAKKAIGKLISERQDRDVLIDSLNSAIENVKSDLELMTRTKNSIALLGMEVNKKVYNSILWTIIAALTGLLVIGFLAYKRNRILTINTKKEYEELKKEFEAYRKASREAREKMSMAHFNELKKLRGA